MASKKSPLPSAFDAQAALASAVKHFWATRGSQHTAQGSKSGQKDAGYRGAVTGGKHADGFVKLVAQIVKNAGLTDAQVLTASKASRTLPGYFRPSKEWDVLVLAGGKLIAAVEVKSQVGSFGNNYNNRVEEALGNATDFWKAYAQGLYAPSPQPWLGYLFMLEDSSASSTPTKRTSLSPFAVDDAFQALSYAQRYEETCLRLVRERLYDGACFFTSSAVGGTKGKFTQPNAELSIENFAAALGARAAAFAALAK